MMVVDYDYSKVCHIDQVEFVRLKVSDFLLQVMK